MKKITIIGLFLLLAAGTAPAQGLRGIGNAIRNEVNRQTNEAKENVQNTVQNTTQQATGAAQGGKAAVNNGPSLYVSAATGGGSRTADGSKEKPFKDLQAAIDKAEEGSVIRVAEGNYLGKMDQGFIEITKYLTVEGGWNDGFTERDFTRYRTMIRPTVAQAGTSGAHALMDVFVKGNLNGTVIIDGFVFDMGQFNMYCVAPNSDPVASAPEGCETGRMIIIDEIPKVPKTDGVTVSRQCLKGTVEGTVIVRNCVFANSHHYAIQMENFGGDWEIYNNIFVANRMAGCEVRGAQPRADASTLDFHHNTVLFTWTRNKLLEDMGYGFRYMTRINSDVHDNIFGGNYYGALDRGRIDSDLKLDAQRVTSAWDNLFFANTMGDICLPSGGGVWAWMAAKDFEEVEQLKRYEGNREVNDSEAQAMNAAINAPYMKGFLGISMESSSSYNENSAMNTFRAAHGMNRQGTEINRVSMYANRYPLDEVNALWGAIPGKGAQK